jgi:hypothetical protein
MAVFVDLVKEKLGMAHFQRITSANMNFTSVFLASAKKPSMS